jgi:hypothetical protein
MDNIFSTDNFTGRKTPAVMIFLIGRRHWIDAEKVTSGLCHPPIIRGG